MVGSPGRNVFKLLIVAFAVGTFPSALVASAPELEEAQAQIPRAELRLTGEISEPLRAGWKIPTNSTSIFTLKPPQAKLALAPGVGCLVILHEGALPQVHRLTLEQERSMTVELEDWMPGVFVQGVVEDELGEALQARLEIKPLPPSSEREEDPDPCASALEDLGVTATTANRLGTFALGAVAAGAYRLNVAAEGYARVSRRVVLDSSSVVYELDPLILRPVAKLELSLDLSRVHETPPFTLKIESANTDPHAYQRDDWWEVASIVLNEESRASFTLAPGVHRLTFDKEGSQVHYSSTLSLAPGTNFITLRPWPISVHGRITDAEGGVADAMMRFMCDGHPSTTSSSEEGHYEIDQWNRTACAVVVSTEEGRQHALYVDLREAELGEAVEKDIRLPGGVVVGEVVDAETKEPLGQAKLILTEEVSGEKKEDHMASNLSAETDAEGRFEFKGVRDSENARIKVEARTEGYLPKSADVEVDEEGEPAELRLELDPVESLAGRVVGPVGEPVAGAQVGCCAAGPMKRFPLRAEADAEGKFSLEAAPGSVVFAAASGYTLGWASAREEEVVIRLGVRSNPVRLVLEDAEGEPVARARLSFSAPEPGLLPQGAIDLDFATNWQRWSTDADGVLELSALPAGLYRAWLLATGEVPQELGPVPVPASGEVTLYLP